MTELLKSCALSDGSNRILVLETNEELAESIGLALIRDVGLPMCLASSVEEAVAYIEDFPDNMVAALVGFEDAGAKSLLDCLTKFQVPAVVYGSDFTDDIRGKLSTLSIADVVTGEGDKLIAEVVSSVGRMVHNEEVTILVVDDSRSMRMALVRFLTNRHYRVVEAANGVEAMKLLNQRPDIKLVITDNEMPEMDGFSLVREIRKTYSKEDLAVIGISAKTNSMLSVKFITNGANDFLQKPFVKEELYCRVDHNVDMLQRIEIIRDLSYKDPLTRLCNRRYFFENAEEFLEQARENGQVVCAAMIDIDHFKQVNDTYGHDAGDVVLKSVATIIADHFPENAIVSRFGGEEFCVLSIHDSARGVAELFDDMRDAVEQAETEVDGLDLKVTLSVGLCTDRVDLGSMLKLADGRLYMAKESGRNKVVARTPGGLIRDRG
ncbi:diguanylate cyclase [Pseudodesulfovibrio sp. zrk46]|uniref:diguanylate cyclase n=1 Tax=Pseudodesulfovibrio sp. zrk46 TaxID=2725288 RepID=UPI001449C12B|nr:diguanylate cyclase [Pseudodesulfovibrio sp. zrk46]QJB55815.1 diguanylate cyclase [Pseudodesulfovibrio sp. zrk46]